ncbi:ras family-domain-containing protein [Filobasidium floriforme]|uniref:ras family-domain-containing protein n=1 Tax=Filobasidium floriforme TaxID=5210 RepID=UPI001E8D1B42|nr:ras family-domain-containing protein [Filobasidium floriforme]KAH8089283.1 ras family-domain-containing protein [Filobasidium floriforme]
MSQNAIRRKLVIVGDGACGKTSLLTVFSLGQFPDSYSPTVFDNFVADIQLDGKPVHLQLWDTAGQEEYERLRPLSYSKAHVILIAFSVDTPDSLDNVTNKWYEEVRSICGQHIPVILVGCKTDLREKARQNGTLQNDSYVETLEGERISKAIGARAYYECSSLLNQGVDDIFEAATRAAMLVRESGHGPSNPAHSRKDTPGGKQSTDEKHGKNCCLIN